MILWGWFLFFIFCWLLSIIRAFNVPSTYKLISKWAPVARLQMRVHCPKSVISIFSVNTRCWMIIIKMKRKVRSESDKIWAEIGDVHKSKVSFPLFNKCKGQNGNIEKEKESQKGRWFLLCSIVSQVNIK